jgi:hypothetical protein
MISTSLQCIMECYQSIFIHMMAYRFYSSVDGSDPLEEVVRLRESRDSLITRHLNTHDPTSVNLNSEDPTSINLNSRDRSSIHLTLHDPTSVHLNSHAPTSFHLKISMKYQTSLPRYVSRKDLDRFSLLQLNIPVGSLTSFNVIISKLHLRN